MNHSNSSKDLKSLTATWYLNIMFVQLQFMTSDNQVSDKYFDINVSTIEEAQENTCFTTLYLRTSHTATEKSSFSSLNYVSM